MKNTIAIIIFQIILLAVFVSSTGRATKFKGPIPTISEDLIKMSADFLADCDYLTEMWPDARAELEKGIEFNVIIPAQQERGVCARFISGGAKHYIFMYQAAWISQGCYEANPMRILAHEMLHQLGLPPHYIRDYEKYTLDDPIEITIRQCTFQAIRELRPIHWPTEIELTTIERKI